MNPPTIVSGQHAPATPTYILRGHSSPIHALHFFHQNLRLVSGDAEGWIVIWNMVTKRPVVVWKAHEGAILEVKGMYSTTRDTTEIYTHGRDHKLRLWKFHAKDEPVLDRTLPVDATTGSRSDSQIQPWLIHSLSINALNFCAFAVLPLSDEEGPAASPSPSTTPKPTATDATTSEQATRSSDRTSGTRPVLIAVPNALNSGAIDLFHLPLEQRICTIPADSTKDTGMVMAVNLFKTADGVLHICSAYEDGQVMGFADPSFFDSKVDWGGRGGGGHPWKGRRIYVNRAHSQPVLSIDVSPTRDYFISSSADAVLAKHPIPASSKTQRPGTPEKEDSALKSVNTKHAGQQGLRVRSDGKIFATAGWDSRVRVYSCKTMRELAVLKWHKEGCYAVAFSEVDIQPSPSVRSMTEFGDDSQGGDIRSAGSPLSEDHSLAAIQRQRNEKVQSTHWLTAGSKDGKISLWDIY